MAHSVEGRFPFLDKDVVDFCNALPPLFKLPGLQEKNILKRVARGLVPDSIVKRPKQPYRAPDAASFLSNGIPEYVTEAFSEAELKQSRLFDPVSVRMLFQKCLRNTRDAARTMELSNVDNMAFVGILSGQLLWRHFVKESPRDGRQARSEFSVFIDRLGRREDVETEARQTLA